MPPPRFSKPVLPEPFASALDDAINDVASRYEPTGILATGTIIRGNPHANSDLDLFVIWNRPERQRVQKFYRGVPAEIFVNPPARIYRYFTSDEEEGRPVTAHMFATGFVVYDSEGQVSELREAAARSIANGPRVSDEARTASRYGVATCFEDAVDLANVDPDTCLALLNHAVEGALQYRFIGGGVWIPRWKDLLPQLNDLDADLAALARQFYGVTSLVDHLRLAREIVRRSVGETGAFEWESRLEIS